MSATSGTKKFVVFHVDAEYHTTTEVSFAYHSSTRGEVKGTALNSLCGAHIGLVPYRGGEYANGKPMPSLYDEPPAGFVLCKACARLMTRHKGWRRILSRLFYYKGLRANSRALSSSI